MSLSSLGRRVALAGLVSALNLGALAALLSFPPTASADGATPPAPSQPDPAPQVQDHDPLLEPAPPTPIAELTEPAPPTPPVQADADLLPQVMPIEDFGGY